ncbi:MAG: hypothetical protein ACWIPH_06455 [Ostreibacterium sp.]
MQQLTFMTVTNWLDTFTIWVAIFTFVMIFINWCNNRINNKKQNASISILLKNTETKKEDTLVQTVKRRHCTRSEIQGILRAADESESYNIAFLSTEAFSNRLEAIQDTKSNTCTLVIDLTNADKFKPFIPNN